MPVFPEGVPKFDIRPPSTTNYDGSPTLSISNDVKQIFLLMEDERHILAHDLLENVRTRIVEFETKYGPIELNLEQSTPTNNNTSKSAGMSVSAKKSNNAFLSLTSKRLSTSSFNKMTKVEKAQYEEDLKHYKYSKMYLESKKHVVHKLENLNRLFRQAQHNLNEDDDWTYASNHFGIKTYYRHEEDGSLGIKLDGQLDGVPLFEQICVLKEVDLHYKWSPFCSSSMTIADLGKLDVVGWFMIGLKHFGIARDGCFRSVGCDNTSVDGSIIIAGRGIQDQHHLPPREGQTLETHDQINDYNAFLCQDPVLEKLDIPPVPTRMGCGRMTIRRFEGRMEIVSPTSARTKIVANIDPNISFLPTTILEFVMKHLAGVVLYKLQLAAKKAMRHPVHNEHARMIRNDERVFYHDWLLPKFESFCRQKGWEMPVISAFNLTKAQVQEEHRSYAKHGFIVRTTPPFETSSNENGNDLIENMPVVDHHGKLSGDGKDGNYIDLLSEISSQVSGSGNLTLATGTGSLFSSNPISNYLREQEEKIKKRKQAEIDAGRRRQLDLLKPKLLSTEQEKRLQELKRVKCRRLDEQPQQDQLMTIDQNNQEGQNLSFDMIESKTATITTHETRAVRKFSLVQRYTIRLHQNGFKARVVLVVFLVGLLFVLLHADLWMSLSSMKLLDVPNYIDSWKKTILDDVAFLFYLSLCAINHFFVCDVVSIYAFDSLEIISKGGFQIKMFYCTNIHVAMAALSTGIVTISLCKCIFIAFIRFFMWSAIQVLRYVNETLSIVLISMQQKLTEMNSTNNTSGFTVLSSNVLKLVIKATTFLKDIGTTALVQKPISMLRRWTKRTGNRFAITLFGEELDTLSGTHKDGPFVLTWRHDAFNTCRTLFAYTSVFLLTILVMFTISARSSSQKIRMKKPKQNNENNKDIFAFDNGSDKGTMKETENTALSTITSTTQTMAGRRRSVKNGSSSPRLFLKRHPQN